MQDITKHFDLLLNKRLKDIIEAALPSDLGPGENVVMAAVDDDGAEIVASYKMRDDNYAVELQGAVRHDWTKGTAAGARLLIRW